MTPARWCKSMFGAGLGLAGLVVWVMAAKSAAANFESSCVWVIFGAALATAGTVLGFTALHTPKPDSR